MDFLDFLEAPEDPEPWPVATSLEALLRVPVGPGGVVGVGNLPAALKPSQDEFEALWDLHPEEFIKFGRFTDKEVFLPRWQRAYEVDYSFSNRVSKAHPCPPEFKPFLAWAKGLDERYNGMLVNWYDDEKGHYIGRHRDSTEGINTEVPILTLSLGGTRNFRMRPFRDKGFFDIPAEDGAVIVIPWGTNARYTHEVPASVRHVGRRISVTFRSFYTYDLSEVLEELA